ncbi:hypothetical protein M6D93_16395 [Jatrophihabitans telluris]|uniref:Uncharacterized protein n=1 Tax=Jatrophihabitans telluris TaxID=2038343 RepID=A0ABY4QXI6_9ACTN|nr:hypothetical protein [Jatrophihabitans telluris]UQX87867.1 hypothetical protein M6D93_16395 [Jatrophihabitans telluris]
MVPFTTSAGLAEAVPLFAATPLPAPPLLVPPLLVPPPVLVPWPAEAVERPGVVALAAERDVDDPPDPPEADPDADEAAERDPADELGARWEEEPEDRAAEPGPLAAPRPGVPAPGCDEDWARARSRAPEVGVAQEARRVSSRHSAATNSVVVLAALRFRRVATSRTDITLRSMVPASNRPVGGLREW